MPLQRFVPTPFDRYISNDKNQGTVKFGHLNAVVDYINNNVIVDGLQLEGEGPLTATPRYITDNVGNLSSLAISSSNIGIGTNTPGARLAVTDTTLNSAFYNIGESYSSNPAEDYAFGSRTLRVAGNGIFIDDFNGTGGTALSFGSGQATKMSFYYQTVGGNPGLTLRNNYAGSTMMRWNRPNNYLSINDYASLAQLYIKGSGSSSATTSLLVRNSGGSDLFTVLDNGNVGIGVTNPTSKLTLSGSIAFSNYNNNLASNSFPLDTAYIGNLRYCTLIADSGGAGIYFKDSGGSAYAKMGFGNLNTTIGQSTFGVVPDLGARLGVRGSGSTSATTSLLVQNSSATNVLAVLDNGYVGINTNAPTRNLTVVGSFATTAQNDFLGLAAGGHVMARINDNGTLLRNDTFAIENATGNAGQQANLAIGRTYSSVARAFITGSGSTSATTSLLVQNSSGNNSLQVFDDRTSTFGNNVTITPQASGGTIYLGLDPANMMRITDLSGYQKFQIQRGISGGAVGLYGGSQGGTSLISNDSGHQFSYPDSNFATASVSINRDFRGNINNNTLNLLYLKSTNLNTLNNAPLLRGIYFAPTTTDWTEIRGFQSTAGGGYFNTSSVQASAILQADSTTQGFLPPCMTTVQRTAITSPAAGLIVYDTTTNKSYTYDGTTWQAHW